MKAKKALKRLNRVDGLLSDVLDQYTASEQDVRALLDAAKAAVVRALDSVNRKVSAALEQKAAASKPAAKPKTAMAKTAIAKPEKAKPGKAKPGQAKPGKAKKTAPPAPVAKVKRKPAVAAARRQVAKAPTAGKRRLAVKRAPAVAAQPVPAPESESLSTIAAPAGI